MAYNDLFGGRFKSQYAYVSKYGLLTGITKDATGATLGGVTVQCYITAPRTFFSTTVSDGSGNYRAWAPTATACFCVGYKAGSPDVAGTTLNTLVGVGGY